jgi:hypothetical protein
VLDYLGRCTHRVAICNHRLLDIEQANVTFRYKDYRNGSRQKTMTVDAGEFIRHFLLHVLPVGLQRIPYYGFLGNRSRSDKLAQCRQLLQMSATTPPPAPVQPCSDYREHYAALTGISLHECPACHQGRMLILGQLLAPATPQRRLDTS